MQAPHRGGSSDREKELERGVFGIVLTLAAAILRAVSGLTLTPTADGLVRTVFGRLKGLLAIRAAAWRENQLLGGMFGLQP
jgi:hypothetical protein